MIQVIAFVKGDSSYLAKEDMQFIMEKKVLTAGATSATAKATQGKVDAGIPNAAYASESIQQKQALSTPQLQSSAMIANRVSPSVEFQVTGLIKSGVRYLARLLRDHHHLVGSNADNDITFAANVYPTIRQQQRQSTQNDCQIHKNDKLTRPYPSTNSRLQNYGSSGRTHQLQSKSKRAVVKLIIVRDPYDWIKSVCDRNIDSRHHSSGLRIPFQNPVTCRRLVDSQNLRPYPVKVKHSDQNSSMETGDTDLTYQSLPHLWSDWHLHELKKQSNPWNIKKSSGIFLNNTKPQQSAANALETHQELLLIRYEDLISHTQDALQTIFDYSKVTSYDLDIRGEIANRTTRLLMKKTDPLIDNKASREANPYTLFLFQPSQGKSRGVRHSNSDHRIDCFRPVDVNFIRSSIAPQLAELLHY